MRLNLMSLLAVAGVIMTGFVTVQAVETVDLQLRYQVETRSYSGRFHRLVREEQWKPEETAIIVCDVWDLHHCRNAVRRVEEFAPRQREDRPGGARGRRQLTGERTSGTVKFFNTTKGFGFIARDDGQADAFVHISAVQRAGMAGLEEGDRVAFDIEVDDRGKFAAVNLQPTQD